MTWTIGSNALGPDNDTWLSMSASPHFRFIDMVFHPVSHKSSVSRDHQPNWEIALFWKTVSKNLLKRKKAPIWNEERKVLWSHTLCRGISYCVIGGKPLWGPRATGPSMLLGFSRAPNVLILLLLMTATELSEKALIWLLMTQLPPEFDLVEQTDGDLWNHSVKATCSVCAALLTVAVC